MAHISQRETLTTTNIVTTSTSDAIEVGRAKSISVQAVVDVNTPAAKTFLAGVAEIQTLTFEAVADIVDREYFVVYDTAGLGWAIYFDKTGTSAAPTGAIYTAIPAARKIKADVSADTTATDVAARVETAIDGLTGFTAVIATDDSAANGTMLFTQALRGTGTAMVSKLLDDSSTGGVTTAIGTAGVASGVTLATDLFTTAAHDYTTGLVVRGTSTGTLPAGITTATDYFVIVVSSTTFKLATSLANALAGTVIDITDQGTSGATHTLTPSTIAGGSITLQKSNNYGLSGVTAAWDAVESATSITADGDIWISDIDPEYAHARVSYTLTAGRLSAATYLVVKKDE